jgi:hypothetical protein
VKKLGEPLAVGLAACREIIISKLADLGITDVDVF